MAWNPRQAGSDFNEVIRRQGTDVTIRFWPAGSLIFDTTEYDDVVRFAGSSVIESGGTILLPLGRSDLAYVEQGKLNSTDVKMYFAGSLNVVPNAEITVGNTGSIYTILPDGIKRHEISGIVVYQEAFGRIDTGSP